MVMLRRPAATLVRPGRDKLSDLPSGNYIYDLQSFPRASRSLLKPHRQGAPLSDESSRVTEEELHTFLKAVATGQTTGLPPRPDLGFQYCVKASPPNVRLSIMPSPIVAKSATTEQQAQTVPTAKQGAGRRPVPAHESFQFLEIHQADSEPPVGLAPTNYIASSSDDSDDDDAYEYGTVIQDRLNKERQNVPATPQPVAVPQARQAGERMPLSTSSSEGLGERDQSSVLQAQAEALRRLLSDAPIADKDDKRMSLSGFTSEGEDENRAIAMARPVSRRRTFSVDYDFVSSESVHVPMARPVSHRRALSSEPNFLSSASICVPMARPVSHRRTSSIESASLVRRSGSCVGRIEQNDHTATVADQVPAWLGLNPQCTAMLFASPSEGCMLRFAHLWDDEDATPIDQSLFAGFEEISSHETSAIVIDVSDCSRSSSRSIADALFDYDRSVQTSNTSMGSRRYSWAVGDEAGLFVPGRGDLRRPQRFVPLPVADPFRSVIAHQHQELSKGRHTRRTFDDFDKFYHLRKRRTMSTVPNGW